jgi:hypothetical protein
MAFKKPSMNKTADSITDLSIYIRSVKKWGKSTLARDIIRAKFDGDLTKGVIVECGFETGDTMLDMNMTHIDTYEELVEFKDWLITQKGKEHDIKSVCFDTVDELVPIFEAEVVRLYNKKNPTKKVDSIKASWGGYNAGVDMAATMIKQYMSEIKKAGFGIFCIGHSRLKTIREKGSLEEDGYMQLTSTLGNSYESAFGDIFDCTVTGYIDVNYDIKDDKKYITNSVRKLFFRSTNLIDAGCRFANGSVPEYLEYPNDMDSLDFAKLFIKTVEEGLAKSKLTPVTSKPAPAETPKAEPTPAPTPEPKEEPTDIADLAEQSDTEMELDELREQAKQAFTDLKDLDKKKAAVAFVKDNGGKITELDLQACYQLLEMLS